MDDFTSVDPDRGVRRPLHDEEPRVVSAWCAHRRHPTAPWGEAVQGNGQIQAPQSVGERFLGPEHANVLLRGPPTVGSVGQEEARLLEALPGGRSDGQVIDRVECGNGRRMVDSRCGDVGVALVDCAAGIQVNTCHETTAIVPTQEQDLEGRADPIDEGVDRRNWTHDQHRRRSLHRHVRAVLGDSPAGEGAPLGPAVVVHTDEGTRVPGQPISGHYRFPMAVPTDREGSPPVADEGADAWAPDDADWLGDDDSEPSGLSGSDGEAGSDAGAGSAVAPENNALFDQESVTAVTARPKPTRRAIRRTKRAKRRAADIRRKQLAKRFAPRRRILPRSVIGICLLLLTTAVAVGGISAALYMNYAYKKDRSEALVQGLDRRIEQGSAKIDAEATNAQARIQDELAPLSKLAATGDTLANLLNASKASMWVVRTFDEAGAPALGTAFVVAADGQRSFLLTSYDVIRAATRDPGPAVTLRQDSTEMKATLWTWDEANDIALLIVDEPSLPKLSWGRPNDVRLGSQVFALSALGTAGGAVTQGFVADVSATGLQHTAPLGSAFRGGPLTDDRGRVIGINSRTFSPLGFTSDDVWFAPPIGIACRKVLRCEADVVRGAGAQR